LSLIARSLHAARARSRYAQHRTPASAATDDTTGDSYAVGGTGRRPPTVSRLSMNVQTVGGKSTMLQQSRTIQGMLVLWGLSLGLVIAGCGGGEDNSAPIQQPPANVATPASVSTKGFRFPTGDPVHIDPVLGEVLLSFGDFQSTNS